MPLSWLFIFFLMSFVFIGVLLASQLSRDLSSAFSSNHTFLLRSVSW